MLVVHNMVEVVGVSVEAVVENCVGWMVWNFLCRRGRAGTGAEGSIIVC